MNASLATQQFVVVFRAASAIRFTEDGHLRITSLKTPSGGTVDLTFRTRYDDAGLELELHLAYESSADCDDRAFIQVFLADERGIPRLTRKANARAASDFIQRCIRLTESDRDRTLRACGQYQQALSNWAPGQELLALAHLYMGVEALTEVILRQECAKRETDVDGLAVQLGVTSGKNQLRCSGCGRISDELRPAIRRKLIFKGNDDCYREAKRASDGFEHGFLGFDELSKLATAQRNATASYLRNAIIEAVSSDKELRTDLSQKSPALGAWKPRRIFRGALVGSGDSLSETGQEYPVLQWKSSIQSAAPTSSGGIAITPSEEITPRLGTGISLRLGAYGVLAPETGIKREPPKEPIVPKFTKRTKRDPDRERVIAVIERLSSRVLDYGSGNAFEATPTDALILAIFAECRSQFQGIVVLLKNGLANEALALAHGLLRNARRLQRLAECDNKKQLALGWLRDSLASGHQMQLAAVDCGLSEGPAPSETELAEMRHNFERLEEKIDARLTGFSSEQLTKGDVGAVAWLGYLASRRILDGFGALMSYGADSTSNGIGFNNICEDTQFISFVAAFAGESVLLACQAAGRLFQWPDFDGLEHFLKELQSNRSDHRTAQARENSVAATAPAEDKDDI
jgi:hypothetical protein